MAESINRLDLEDKESIVSLLMDVQAGKVSCRRAASEIRKQLPKRRLLPHERENMRVLRQQGQNVNDLAVAFDVDPATVWRICKPND